METSPSKPEFTIEVAKNFIYTTDDLFRKGHLESLPWVFRMHPSTRMQILSETNLNVEGHIFPFNHPNFTSDIDPDIPIGEVWIRLDIKIH